MLGWEDLAENDFARFVRLLIESCAGDDSGSEFECKAYKHLAANLEIFNLRR